MWTLGQFYQIYMYPPSIKRKDSFQLFLLHRKQTMQAASSIHNSNTAAVNKIKLYLSNVTITMYSGQNFTQNLMSNQLGSLFAPWEGGAVPVETWRSLVAAS